MLIARKMESTVHFGQGGSVAHMTLLEAGSCAVMGHKTEESDGYSAVVVAAFPGNVKRPQGALFDKLGIERRRTVREFRVGVAAPPVGELLSVGMFSPGQLVNVVGRSKGKGFAGAMKRHGFAGLEASHGVSITHRSHGSTGHRTYPSKVFKGKRMAGHMGFARVTVKNLEVVYVDAEKGLIGVRGAVPGPVYGFVTISAA
jgi:large subunit ribosomal protein L3